MALISSVCKMFAGSFGDVGIGEAIATVIRAPRIAVVTRIVAVLKRV